MAERQSRIRTVLEEKENSIPVLQARAELARSNREREETIMRKTRALDLGKSVALALNNLISANTTETYGHRPNNAPIARLLRKTVKTIDEFLKEDGRTIGCKSAGEKYWYSWQPDLTKPEDQSVPVAYKGRMLYLATETLKGRRQRKIVDVSTYGVYLVARDVRSPEETAGSLSIWHGEVGNYTFSDSGRSSIYDRISDILEWRAGKLTKPAKGDMYPRIVLDATPILKNGLQDTLDSLENGLADWLNDNYTPQIPQSDNI